MHSSRQVQLALFIIICGICIAWAGGGASAQSSYTEGSPDLTVYTPDNQVAPGAETSLTVQIDNDGRIRKGVESNRGTVTTARSVVTSLDAEDTPITVKTNEESLGDITDSKPENADFNIEVPDDAATGTYELEVHIEYTYTSRASDPPGERASQTTKTRSITEEIEIEIDDDARFRVTNVDSTLRVGEEGDITGEVTNIGGEDVTNAEVQFPTESSSIEPLESEVSVGDIGAGESAAFRIPVDVSSEAEAVPKRFDLPVSFRDKNGIRQTDDDPELLADVAEKRDAFNIEPVDASIAAGNSQSLEIEVTNQLDEPVTDIEGKLFADDPLDSSDDETFTESLEPGETTTVTVDLSADGAATVKNHPVSMDFRYTEADGDSKLSDSYRMAIDVTEPQDDDGLPIGAIIAGASALVGVGALLWRRSESNMSSLWTGR